MPRSKPLTHGPSGYQRGCRCDTCRTEMAEKRNFYRNRDYETGKKFSVFYGSSKLRLPADPLIRFLERRDALGSISRHTLAGWKRDGMSVYQVDWWCIRLGTHPAMVYGDAFYEGAI